MGAPQRRVVAEDVSTAVWRKRLIATTEHDNAASIGVMRKLGMRVEKNPFPDPPWLQVVEILEHPDNL